MGTVNYPNDFAYTRVSEFEHLTGQRHHATSVVYEYPRSEGDLYHPVPRAENTAMYRLYEAEAKKLRDVSFVGRLATYKYYNMDQVVAQSLTLFKALAARQSRELAVIRRQRRKPRWPRRRDARAARVVSRPNAPSTGWAIAGATRRN